MSIDVHGVAHRVHAGVATIVHHVGVAMRAIGIGQLFPPQHGGVEVFVGKSARDVGESVEDEREFVTHSAIGVQPGDSSRLSDAECARREAIDERGVLLGRGRRARARRRLGRSPLDE